MQRMDRLWDELILGCQVTKVMCIIVRIECYSGYGYVKPFPKRQILDLSKLKAIADDNFKFDENGRKFFRRVENTVGKGEIARYEQFLLFPQCFQKALFPRGIKRCHCVGMG